MQNLTPQINLSADLPISTAGSRTATPSSVGHSIFKKMLQDSSGGEDASCGLNLLLFKGQDTTGGNKSLSFLNGRGGSADRLILDGRELQKLADYLKKKGFSSEDIDRFLLSIADAKGAVSMDRLLAKLDALHRAGMKDPGRQVVECPEIPRVAEALFKMGLKAEEVDQAIRKSLTEQGNLDLNRLTRALGGFFTGIRPETQDVLAATLNNYFDIQFSREGAERKINGMKELLSRFTEEATQGAQKAIKGEIAALLREKGLQPEEITRFLETLKLQKKEIRSFSDGSGRADENSGKLSRTRSEDPLAGIYLRKDTSDFSKGDWKEKIMGILQKDQAVSASGPNTAPHGKSEGLQKDALVHPLLFAKDGRNAKETVLHGRIRNDRSSAVLPPDGKGSAETRTGDKTNVLQSPRPTPGFEFSLSRADRMAAQDTSNIRGPAPTAPLPEPLPKLVDRMVWMVRAGEQTSRIHISPPELGRLDLDIVIRQGHLHANLSAENPLAKELIEANLQQLKQQLNNLGFVVERFDVHAGLDERRFMGGNHGPGAGKRHRQRAQGPGGEGPNRVESLGGKGRVATDDYRIDVLV